VKAHAISRTGTRLITDDYEWRRGRTQRFILPTTASGGEAHTNNFTARQGVLLVAGNNWHVIMKISGSEDAHGFRKITALCVYINIYI